ncbi:hypothetical protein HG531_004769 [Fusarium graminearum]|nr:hypothetical protein HG531_004769 [Fusarium graminearum]
MGCGRYLFKVDWHPEEVLDEVDVLVSFIFFHILNRIPSGVICIVIILGHVLLVGLVEESILKFLFFLSSHDFESGLQLLRVTLEQSSFMLDLLLLLLAVLFLFVLDMFNPRVPLLILVMDSEEALPGSFESTKSDMTLADKFINVYLVAVVIADGVEAHVMLFSGLDHAIEGAVLGEKMIDDVLDGFFIVDERSFSLGQILGRIFFKVFKLGIATLVSDIQTLSLSRVQETEELVGVGSFFCAALFVTSQGLPPMAISLLSVTLQFGSSYLTLRRS